MDTSNRESKFEVKRSNVKITGTKNVKVVFCTYRQYTTKTIPDRSYTYHRIDFTSRNEAILCYLSVCRIPFVHSILERGKKFFFLGGGNLPLRLASSGSLRSKG